MCIPFCRCELPEFLISCVTYFSCVVLLSSSFFFLLYFMVVCGHWSKVGIDCVIKKRKKKKHTSPHVLPTGRPVPVRIASLTSHTPHIPFPSFHLWFMGCPSIFLAFFLLCFHGLFLFCFTFSSSCQYVLSILFTSVAEKLGVKVLVFLKLFLITTWASLLASHYLLPSALARTCNSEIQYRTNKRFLLGHKAVKICYNRWVYFLSLLNSEETEHLFSFSLSSGQS